jgi:hypothetical protein
VYNPELKVGISVSCLAQRMCEEHCFLNKRSVPKRLILVQISVRLKHSHCQENAGESRTVLKGWKQSYPRSDTSAANVQGKASLGLEQGLLRYG